MKTNVIFAWPVLTTIFTSFLYWSGYWYFLGYTDFYDYQLKVFDMPLSTLIIEGLSQNVSHVIWLTIILLLISFITSVNKEQWKYVTLSSLSIIISIFMFTAYLLKPLFSLTPNLGISSRIQTFNPPWLISFKNFLKIPARYLVYAVARTKRYIRLNKLTEKDIRKQSFTSVPPYSFYFSVCVHYIGLIFLLVCLLCLFKSAAVVGMAAKNEAANDFKFFNKMSKVILKENPQTDYRNTGVCFKGFCLITDIKKNVIMHEMKETEVRSN